MSEEERNKIESRYVTISRIMRMIYSAVSMIAVASSLYHIIINYNAISFFLSIALFWMSTFAILENVDAKKWKDMVDETIRKLKEINCGR